MGKNTVCVKRFQKKIKCFSYRIWERRNLDLKERHVWLSRALSHVTELTRVF